MSMPPYAEVVHRATAAALALGGRVEPIGELEDYPLLRLAWGRADGPDLLIDAGLHGEEPASVLGLLTWLESGAARWRDRLACTILPCLNPYGFEHGTRNSRDTEDLNRHFDEPAAPLTGLVAAALDGRRYALAMDLHEDCDFSTFYLYELKAGPPYLGERLLQAGSAFAPLSHEEPVGESRTAHGLLRPADLEQRLRLRTGWPIAFAHYRNRTGHTITVESPGQLPLATRIAIHGACLDEACAFLTGDAETDGVE